MERTAAVAECAHLAFTSPPSPRAFHRCAPHAVHTVHAVRALVARSPLSVSRSVATSASATQVAAVPSSPPTTLNGSASSVPTWSEFELGASPVFWETVSGGTPTAGDLMTVYFNPSAVSLQPGSDFGIAFNGGFNSPIMCGGEARQMTRKERGPNCDPFYTIRINVPKHALSMEFCFTNGSDWTQTFALKMAVPPQWTNKPASFFNENLSKELSSDEACLSAIFPDAAYVADRCIMPGGLGTAAGKSCELDLVAGCMDPESPAYDPLAVVDDGSCLLEPPNKNAAA